ncbi:SDR family NAD(P)-dependent oxidoreductase [Limosilactobacillus reuteri]|uniref:SDR family NAD(P)-dependent oxidoreductase n=1 Tax=Limosilactobacillus reuteri TaxID=1598 RepID=UPI001E3EE82E|nr:SDR family NAD(P)-dependent oxidoreductase [Limosilactobacillus reuteri]MCC4380918.1 SDR family NAD(P)-dependent oxidoreductase [Limosilactobacillus reuteri]
MKTILVIGAGSGLGNAVARQFGWHGFKVALMARNPQSLEKYKAEFNEKGIETVIQTVDVTKLDEVKSAYQSIRDKIGTPDVLFYNVGITIPDETTSIDAQSLIKRYQADVVGAYAFIQLVMSDQKFVQNQGTILLTGGGLALNPSSKFLPLSMDKAALRAMAIALHSEYQSKGVDVGIVNICGAIGKSKKYMPKNIAQKYWQLYQDKNKIEITF